MSFTEHPIGFPEWEAANPSGSFQKFANHMREQAKNYLLEDGYHAEMMFFMPLEGKGTLVFAEGEGNDRDAMALRVRDYIAKNNIFGFVHVCEFWVKFADSPNDPTVKQIVAEEIKVSQLKPEHRTEALSVSAQSRDCFSVNWVDEMVRHKKKGTLKLGKCHQFNDIKGRFGKLFG